MKSHVGSSARSTVIAFFAGSALAGGLLLGGVSTTAENTEPLTKNAPEPLAEVVPGTDDVTIATPAENEPCTDLEKLPPAQMKRASEVPVVLPDLKSDTAEIVVVNTGFCNGVTTLPVVEFRIPSQTSVDDQDADASPMWAFFEEGYPEQHTKEWFTGLLEDWGGSIVEVNGAPAYVNPPALPSARQQIIMTVPGTDSIVRLQAPSRVSPEQLFTLARSFPPMNKAGG